MSDSTITTRTNLAANRQKFLRKRYRAEKRFRLYGISAIAATTLFVVALLVSVSYSAIPAFTHHSAVFEVDLLAEKITPDGGHGSDYAALVRHALYAAFPDITTRRDKRALRNFVSSGAGDNVRSFVLANPDKIGQRVAIALPLSDDIDLVMKGLIDRTLPEADRVVSNRDLMWLDRLVNEGRVSQHFAWNLFTQGDSREPEMAGIKGALVGSLLTIFVTFLFSFPLGVLAAIYLQEFAPKNRATAIIEVNINNLAAVPSIVFGLLGLAVFINFFQFPRSAPLVGGMVLALMTMPTIIIATRAALGSVPPSIRQAALGVGASRLQVVLHHVLPLALPGILTGTIIGLAQAAGETAPLLMIGMMAFIVDVPTDITAKATVLPAQIYMWANNPERAFVARTSAAIVVLLVFLLFINAMAVYLRKNFEKRW